RVPRKARPLGANARRVGLARNRSRELTWHASVGNDGEPLRGQRSVEVSRQQSAPLAHPAGRAGLGRLALRGAAALVRRVKRHCPPRLFLSQTPFLGRPVLRTSVSRLGHDSKQSFENVCSQTEFGNEREREGTRGKPNLTNIAEVASFIPLLPDAEEMLVAPDE